MVLAGYVRGRTLFANGLRDSSGNCMSWSKRMIGTRNIILGIIGRLCFILSGSVTFAAPRADSLFSAFSLTLYGHHALGLRIEFSHFCCAFCYWLLCLCTLYALSRG